MIEGQIPAPEVYTEPIAWRSESDEVQLGAGFYLLGVADAVGNPAPPLSPLVTYDYTATPGGKK